MAEPVLCGSSETVATLAELGGKSSGQGQAASIKTLKGGSRWGAPTQGMGAIGVVRCAQAERRACR